VSFLPELHQAIRRLRRTPTLSFAAVICLGLGIGATAAIFSAVSTALLRPLPFRDPGRLVTIFRTTPNFDTGPFAPANYIDLARGPRTLEGIAAIAPGVALLEGTGESRRVSGYGVADNLFELLGVETRRGRLFRPGDGGDGQPLVAVVSEGLWREQFGADPGLVGRAIRLDGQTYEVVGIVPAGFRIPHGPRSYTADVWTTLRFGPEQAAWRRSNYLSLLGRLRPGATVEAAHAELVGTMEGLIEAYPELRGEQLRVLPLHRESTRTVRGPLLLLLGATALVLLIAASNVASLLLARGVERGREIAVRTALGASPRDVVRAALWESALLAVAGTVLGVGLAWLGVRAIGSLAAARLPQLAGLGLDGPVLLVALALGLAVALGCGIAPAWRAARSDPQDALRAGPRTGSGQGHHRYLRLLVAAEVGLSLVLLLGAGLVVRGFLHLVNQDPGFEPGRLLTLTVNVVPDRYAEGGTVRRFLEPVLEAVRGVPGVEEAASISLMPFVNYGTNRTIRYEGRAEDDPTRMPLVEIRNVSQGYFAAMGLTLLRGRLLEPTDGESSPIVVVVNQALAARDFPGQDPIGQRFQVRDTTWGTIVGVVGNVSNAGPGNPPRPEMYWSYLQAGAGTGFPLIVRTSGDPAGVARSITAAISSVDPSAAVSEVMPMPELMARSVGGPRFYLILLSGFAGVAVGLAIAGLYGLTSYMVAQRTRELGIRTALGSTPGDTIRLVLGQGMGLTALGLAGGLAGGFAITRLLRSLLYGVSPLDPVTWLLVTGVLAVVAALAILAPARRAARVDPIIAIREE
jgi:putative ABC transport system permease protein